MATDIIARGMITEYKSGTNISFKENEDGSVTISASGDVSSEDTVARETIDNHKLNKNNPHNVTAEQVGLNNVDNTADLDKPISTAVQTALNDKANTKHTHKKSDITDFPNSLPVNGGNADTVNNHTVNSDVPANALFTDTVYDDTEIDNRVKKNTDDISQLFDITKGGESVIGNSSYTIENTVDYPLIGLSLYGKSTQNGTPTPNNPVDIVSVGDNGFDIVTKNDEHFNLLSVRDNGNGIITKQPVSAVGKIGKKATFTVTASGTGLTYQWQYFTPNATEWKKSNSAGNDTNALIASIDNGWKDVKVRCVVTDGSGNVEISDEAALYIVSDDCEITTASIATDALPLCGIPVENGGNYTDSNGQQWICDELIFNADGTGKIIKHTEKTVFDGSDDERWINAIINSEFTNDLRIQFSKINGTLAENINSSYTFLYCNRLQYNNTIWDTDVSGCQIASIGDFIVRMPSSVVGGTDVTAFKSWLASNPLIIVYQIVPQEIELTAAEVDALRTLQTFDGTTSISNSADAEMSVKYCTNKALSEYVLPITKGLQAQIDELRAAVLSLGGNV